MLFPALFLAVPTRVGVNLIGKNDNTQGRRCPHTRGGEPVPSWQEGDPPRLSPHAWG